MWPLLCVWSVTKTLLGGVGLFFCFGRSSFGQEKKQPVTNRLSRSSLPQRESLQAFVCLPSPLIWVYSHSQFLVRHQADRSQALCMSKQNNKCEARRRKPMEMRGKSGDISSFYEDQIPCVGTSEGRIEFHFARTKSVSSCPPFLFSFPRPSPLLSYLNEIIKAFSDEIVGYWSASFRFCWSGLHGVKGTCQLTQCLKHGEG